MNSKKRIAVINYDVCNFEKCGNYLCEKVCPVNRTGKKCITHENLQKPIISEEQCIGCEICQNKCPFGAISIVNVMINLGEPIHSFGKNTFRLHGLPVPKENSVVGLVGRNGIGKTTITKILSGNIIPNFGEKNEEKESAQKKVIEYYRGKKEQEFFKKVYNNGITIAVKPQNIEAIKPTGTVGELLLKVDEKKELDVIAKELQIENILDRDSSKLSGGEFQKIAIAATALKKAEVYFFDEPTSFLDIRERLRVAKFIRKLAENSTVLVVEHDLILLDYLSDFVHLIYGKPKVYGFVSQIKTTREGINDYLEGFSKEENYKFREYQINFYSTIKTENTGKKEKIIQWPELKKKLGEFELTVEENKIQKNEIVGIIGPNGIGKTTFMKILAGEIKADNTEIQQRVKISYKPQYINYVGEKTVQELFEGINMEEVRNNLLKPLELEPLLEKKAKTLSGGEFQRLSIAICLSKKADVYLLDEPSAYLDVEQRLAVGKLIRNYIDIKNCSAIIIDHDLTFMDYVSDKIMVFTGEPTKNGKATGPFGINEGMNHLLKYLDITVRRDKDTKRPRINKHDSVLDREQKKENRYYK
ncbi:MAG TPA: ribosome biogenesis/translation initiation ATPase RLI [archaeon]|nr:ribosome biogenesis/translation initiation ATPase RLI [archaeon]